MIVGELKKEIQREMPITLANIEAASLTISKISVHFKTTDDYYLIIDQISKGIFQFEPPKQELLPTRLVSSFFQGHLDPDMIEILVELPKGESI